MPELTHVTIIGIIKDTPELRYTKESTPVLNLRIAVGKIYHRCVVWGERAEPAAQDLNPGDLVCFVGTLTRRGYDDSDGNKQWITEVTGRVFKGYPKMKEVENETENDRDDVPF